MHFSSLPSQHRSGQEEYGHMFYSDGKMLLWYFLSILIELWPKSLPYFVAAFVISPLDDSFGSLCLFWVASLLFNVLWQLGCNLAGLGGLEREGWGDTTLPEALQMNPAWIWNPVEWREAIGEIDSSTFLLFPKKKNVIRTVISITPFYS